ncbi:MAG: sigma-54 dependent transcriptional regulator [Longimicrobiales bacterium]
MAPKRHTVLIIDDDPGQLALLAAQLERRGHFRTQTTTSPTEGLSLAEELAPDLVICDVSMPGMDGLEVTRRLKSRYPALPVIILTGLDREGGAEAAYAAGATDFAAKPLEGAPLVARVEHALQDSPQREHLLEVARRERSDQLILGAHPRIEAVRQFIHNVASVPRVPALILGESGTGKNLVSRAIHGASEGAPYRFVEVNCAALPANLLEAELFGYEKGAFTDARQAKQGLVEVAAGGTLMLDEIGTLPLELQAKLLTFLESRHFRRVGGTDDREVQLRIVAATNADLESDVQAGRFREDLYYRLNVAQVTLPPLRDIRSDIPQLVEYFVARTAGYYGRTIPRVAPRSLTPLQLHDWPGNVRELRNVIERAMIFAKGDELAIPDPARAFGTPGAGSEDGAPGSGTDASAGPGSPAIPLGLTLEEVERRYIEATLDACDGQVAVAAERLGVTRKVLWMRRKKLGILP